jgi:hypothetical protein
MVNIDLHHTLQGISNVSLYLFFNFFGVRRGSNVFR